MNNIKASHAMLYQYMSDNVAPGSQQLSCMSPHLYVGTLEHANDPEMLKDVSITAILTLTEGNLDKKVLSVYKKRKIALLHLSMSDDPKENVQGLLQESYGFIHDHIVAGGKVLVHCREGASRAVTVVMYYYLARLYATNYHKSKKIMMRLLDPANPNLMEIAKFIKGRRPCALPNPGYAYQLVMMEYAMKSYYARGIVEEATEVKERIIEEGNIDPEISHIIESDNMSVPQAIELVFGQEASQKGIPDEVEKAVEEFDDMEEIPSLLGSV